VPFGPSKRATIGLYLRRPGYFFESLAHAADTRPGIRELIRLVKAAGLPLAIASSSRHEWVDGHLTRLGLFQEFDAICCADDVARAKPAPDLYLLALHQLGVRAGEALVLEDSPAGVTAAKAAGLTVFAYPNPLTSFLSLDHADARIDRADNDLVLRSLGL